MSKKRICVASFRLTGSKFTRSASVKMSTYRWGVFLGPSILDHSCRFPLTTNLDTNEWILRRPNAAVSFTGSLLTVRALQPLDSLEDALITYVDPDLPGPARWKS